MSASLDMIHDYVIEEWIIVQRFHQYDFCSWEIDVVSGKFLTPLVIIYTSALNDG